MRPRDGWEAVLIGLGLACLGLAAWGAWGLVKWAAGWPV